MNWKNLFISIILAIVAIGLTYSVALVMTIVTQYVHPTVFLVVLAILALTVVFYWALHK